MTNSKQAEKWYHRSGEQGDVVISTRVRLARNLRGFPFPDRMSLDQRQKVCGMVRDALLCSNSAIRDDFTYYDMAEMTDVQALSLAERHLISPEFARHRKGRALLLKKDESVSIMLCEEDHVRIQVMQPGLQLDEAYDLADKLDTLLDSQLHFAFDDRLGYLTQCPTNLGTGMRASLMMHLPALESTGLMAELFKAVSKIGLVFRGLYGEGSKPQGAIYQLSNQITLGISEQDALQNLGSIAGQVIEQEKAAVEKLDRTLLEDRVFRSLGVMQNARVLGSEECMDCLSHLRLGAATGLIRDLPFETLNALLCDMQPANLTEADPHAADPAVRDRERAARVRQALAGARVAE